MRLRTVLIVGLAIRLAIAPFFAHPFDVYSWYKYGEFLLSGKQSVWTFLVPYSYSFFLFAFPATALFNFLGTFIPTYTLQMSSLNPILNPGAPWNIPIVPGILFDLLVKLPLIASDTLVAWILYRLVLKHFGGERYAVLVSAMWFLNPLTIWISSAWGTFDTLPALFTVLALYLALEKKFDFAMVAIVIAIALKYYAVVLILPLLILAFRYGLGLRKVILYGGLSALVIFSPFVAESVPGLVKIVGVSSAPAPHTSGLSFWTTLTLFYSNFNQSLVSSVLAVAAIAVSYVWIWKHSRQDLSHYTLAFLLPITSLLLFYRFVGENFFIWILPFASILSLRDSIIKKSYWILSLVVLVSSMTDSLLPYYLLPVSPWIGGYLVHIMSILTPYRVAPGGSVVSGLTAGKVFLASLGILSFVLLILTTLRLVRHENQLETLNTVAC